MSKLIKNNLRYVIWAIISLIIITISFYFYKSSSKICSSIVGICTSILGTIICDITKKFHYNYQSKVVTFNQIDEDFCQLNLVIGSLYYGSLELHKDLQILDKRDIDFSTHHIKSLIDATIDGLWSLKMSSNRVANQICSRFTDIMLNIKYNSEFDNKALKKIDKMLMPITDNELSLPDYYFNNIFSKRFLRQIILNDRFNSYRKKLDNDLISITKLTQKDLDRIVNLRKFIAGWQ